MPFLLFAGIDNFRAQVEGIKQNCDVEMLRQRSVPDCLGCQFGKLFEGYFQFDSMFFLNVQPRAPWNSDTMIIQTRLHDGMSRSVLAGGVMMKLADTFHLPGSLKSLGVIDNEKQMLVLLGIQTEQHIQSYLSHYYGFIPDASPEKFAVISAMSSVPQRLDEPVNGTAITDTDRQ
jgi:hypothetical protein